jgi:serine/threonine protein phosphatase PrpC
MSPDESHEPGGPGKVSVPADGPVRTGTLIGTVATPMRLLSLYSEKRPGLGEDSEPLAEELAEGACVVVGVFDGLGGSGATQIETVKGPRSSAYVASRLARDVSRDVVDEEVVTDAQPRGKHAGGGDWGVLLRDRLNERLSSRLRDYHEKHGGTTSRLRSKLLRPLPTTLALAVVRSGGPAAFTLHALWAGDSRVYLLGPDAGLQQLTIDDLRTGGDAMQNLSDESRMSNLVSADGRFHVNLNQRTVLSPAVVIAATDGCFGYVRTPAQFEDIILSCLRETAAEGSWDAWRDALKREILRITGDDATLAMACLGWDSLPDMARSLDARGRVVGGLMRRLEHAQTGLERAREALASAKTALDDTANQLWTEYRGTYEHLLPSPPPDAAPAVETPTPEPLATVPSTDGLSADEPPPHALATPEPVDQPPTWHPPSVEDRDDIGAVARAAGLMPEYDTGHEPTWGRE